MESPDGCDPDEQHLFIPPAKFEMQMADLARRGFRSVSLNEYQHAGPRTVLITFDDGYAHVADTVTPVLRRFGFTAVMFVSAGYLGANNQADAVEHPRIGALDIVTAEQIAEMSAGPWEISSHGFHHVDLRNMEPPIRFKELIESRDRLSEISTKPVDALAYPYGEVNQEVERAAVRAGYRMAFTAWPGPSGNAFRIPRHPIAGTDGINVFRLKTSGLYRRMHPLYALTSSRTRQAVRAVLNRTSGAAN